MSRLHHRTVGPAAVVLLALSFIGGLVSVIALEAPATAQQTADRLQFCRDASGEPLPGDIDILLLLDDTLSLERQDRNESRFEVLANFFRDVSSIESERRVNLATFTFGIDAAPIFDFRALEPADVPLTIADIRTRNTAQQNKTDFVKAVQRASAVLSTRPTQNCKILLWFTDGSHDASNVFNEASDRNDADGLRTAFCPADGLADRLRTQRINTFVLLLDPPPIANTELRLEASKDVFQSVTGDPLPGFPKELRPDRELTPDCARPLGEQLGKVFAVEKAEEMVAIIADFINAFEDASRATAEQCPYNVGALDSLPLPDAHLIDWFSLTDFALGATSRPPTLDRMTVLTAQGERLAAGEVLESFRVSGPSTRFRVIEAQRERLGAGWQIALPDAEDLCLRSRPRDLLFRLSTGEQSLDVVAPRGLPARLWDAGQLQLLSPGGQRLDVDAALRSAEVRGRLAIEQGQLFAADGTLAARVIVDGAPTRSSTCSAMQIPSPDSLDTSGAFFSGGLEAPRSAVLGSECIVIPATRGEEGGTVDFTATLAALNRLSAGATEAGTGEGDRCAIGADWHVLVDGRRSDGPIVRLPAGGAPVSLVIASGVNAPDADRDCIAESVAPVELRWQSQSVAIPVSLTAQWQRRGSNSIAIALTMFALLTSIAISLGLLRLLNGWLLAAPEAVRFSGMEFRGSLVVDSHRKATFEFDRESIQTQGQSHFAEGDATEVKCGDSAFRRELPSLVKPFAEPVLRLRRGGNEPGAVVSYPSTTTRGAVPLDFDEVIVASSVERGPATPDRAVPVEFVILVPNQGRNETDAEAANRLLSVAQRRGVADRLQKELERLSQTGTPKAARATVADRKGPEGGGVTARQRDRGPKGGSGGSTPGPRDRGRDNGGGSGASGNNVDSEWEPGSGLPRPRPDKNS